MDARSLLVTFAMPPVVLIVSGCGGLGVQAVALPELPAAAVAALPMLLTGAGLGVANVADGLVDLWCTLRGVPTPSRRPAGLWTLPPTLAMLGAGYGLVFGLFGGAALRGAVVLGLVSLAWGALLWALLAGRRWVLDS